MQKWVLAHPAWTDDPTCAWWKPWAQAIRTAGLDGIRFDISWQDPNAVAKCQAIVGMLGPVRAVVSLGGSGPAWQAPDPQKYAEVAANVALTLNAGDILQTWNEPTIAPNFWPAPTSASAYAVLAQATYDAVKAVARHVLVSGPQIPFADTVYLNTVLDLSPRAFDLIGVHPYTVNKTACPDDPDSAENGWQSFRTCLQMASDALIMHGLTAGITADEVGWPVADPGPSHYRAAVQIARAMGVIALGAYNLGDNPAEQNAYSLMNPDMTSTLALTAFVEA